jgi:hypothetical protein
MSKEGRKVYSLQRSAFGEYDLDGPVQDGVWPSVQVGSANYPVH